MADTGVDMTGYKAVQFTLDQVHVTGGFLNTPLPVTAKRCQVGDNAKYFVKMAAKEKWLVKATCGPLKRSETSFMRTSLLDDLRDRAQRACNGECHNDREEDEADEERDCMDDINVADDSQSPTKQTGDGKRARYNYQE